MKKSIEKDSLEHILTKKNVSKTYYQQTIVRNYVFIVPEEYKFIPYKVNQHLKWEDLLKKSIEKDSLEYILTKKNVSKTYYQQTFVRNYVFIDSSYRLNKEEFTTHHQ